MTLRECVIVTAHTGVLMIKGEDFGELYKYAEEVTGIAPYTHDFADRDFIELLKEKSKPDFLKLCEEAAKLGAENRQKPLLGRLKHDRHGGD